MHNSIVIDYNVVNAFTHIPLEGNPVAVFHDSEALSAPVMQAIARQLQLSETTFISERTEDGHARVRIFTPVNELPFAGHPLMGAASAFSRRHGLNHFVFHTDIGVIPISVEHHSKMLSEVKITVPLASAKPFAEEKKLLAALSLEKTELPVEIYDVGARHVLVAVNSISTLHGLQPDHRALADFDDLAVNCFSWQGKQVENRMFSPAYGVTEDAGTGSVVGPIAQHLIKYGKLQMNEKLVIEQGILLNRRCVMYGEIKSKNDLASHTELSGQVCHFSECRARF
ncbi:PhzF family phenazine biosynthesis protein [Xenorhabdus bovienii]|uniref:PhzF family phenazine biosynthesis protein n=1 Tax=Xenorhabdus bovienii TaxID=40576 RepID=A0AAJ1N2I7_XENBV|nr:PhzF family phenazine biosynthesis protein [Xenorhabdus bovienii]MDE1479727.1 PhzF family phenazine biosynthesis protein [Xenorhabdus bovienii]MDE1491156.1 PhzF family phenazine biosynthesis protein [Xenorhabdus bovienii]MDE9511546.1 PhzF family phenazine biosynthesis protein [Xenorhabdus bovienii]MDE9523175.1 PhzF family phenazine biosynthesis protein [Xenorhabdus bovienii]